MRYANDELRRFGIGFGVMLIVFFWLLLPWLFEYSRPHWPVYAAGAFAIAALAWPPLLAPLNWLWERIAHALGTANTFLLLGITYVFLVTPLGLVMRRRAKLQYRRGLRPDAESYRVNLGERRDPRHMEKPY